MMPRASMTESACFGRAGFCLALCHDLRVMKEGEAKGKALFAMNEVEFGAPIPVSPFSALAAEAVD